MKIRILVRSIPTITNQIPTGSLLTASRKILIFKDI
jgi:hypothetical protein